MRPIEPVYAELGVRIRVYRETRRISQESLGAVAGITRAAVSAMETGRMRIHIHILVAFCELLGVPVAGMLTFDGRGRKRRK